MIKFLSLILLSCILLSCESESSENSNASSDELEQRIQSLINEMSLEEKLGQLALRGKSSRDTDQLSEELLAKVRNGEIGAFLNVMDTAHMRQLQEVAVNESKHGIPLIFARDVIHGFKTIFPIPLGQAASWNPEIVQEGSRIAALEASSVGIRWTFAPMLDICQDSRWGRIAESPGEDPHLASRLSEAYIRGFQGEDLSQATSIAACAKHFIAYGAAIGGRDYNTAIISEELLYNLYLPPFRTAVDEGAATFMAAFNEVNGVPASGDERMLRDILRDEMNFDGFVVSDWESITEMIPHGYAADEREAAYLAAKAGVDMEMTSQSYDDYFLGLIEQGELKESDLDFYVANILRIKLRLGLFDTPFIPADHPGAFYQAENLEKSKIAAIESSVLLKNEDVLPLTGNKKILLTGPLSDHGREQLGTWTFDGEGEHSVTPRAAMPDANWQASLEFSRDKGLENLPALLNSARASDVIVFVAGEEAILSGEAHSRADIRLPGAQETYIKELAKTGKPIVLVIMAGRAIDISNIIDDVEAIIMMWHPGTMGGPAFAEMLNGVSPSGKLPISWPKAAGQLPYYYNHKNTGRPANPEKYVGIDDIPIGAWQSSLGNESHYLDLGYEPLFPFGYGLSYSKFEYSDLKMSAETIAAGESIEISASVRNTGDFDASEVAQLYIRDVAGRITRPVRELKAFEKVTLNSGEAAQINFTLSYEDLKYYDSKGNFAVEPGEIKIWLGGSSVADLGSVIRVK
jgi:beta-glucosidase